MLQVSTRSENTCSNCESSELEGFRVTTSIKGIATISANRTVAMIGARTFISYLSGREAGLPKGCPFSEQAEAERQVLEVTISFC